MQRGAAAIGREYKEGDARRHERMNALRVWQSQGRVRMITADKPITDPWPIAAVVVGDEYFSEPTMEFPSEELFARIGLAVNFGGHGPLTYDPRCDWWVWSGTGRVEEGYRWLL